MNQDNFLNSCPPPWHEFPEINPDEPRLTQGLMEWWFDQIWRPFWIPLTIDQRERYLEYWQAPKKWREALQFMFPYALDYDPEEDMKESEEYLRKCRENRPKRPFFSRLFGFRK